jgi:hypothetical protein
MKTRLFENTGGNKFRLLKESVNVNESLVASGLKKVFMNAGSSISYNHIESVGMGYIKDINTAKQVALQEARILAKEYGYKEDEDKAGFVKENDFSKLDAQNPSHAHAKVGSNEAGQESNTSNQEEQQEIQIGKQILAIIESDLKFDLHPSHEAAVAKIKTLAEQLIKMHGQQ